MAKGSFSDHFRKLSRAEAAAMGQHPEAEELLGYQEGRLGRTRELELQEHLALCPECTETILDLANISRLEERLVPGHIRTVEDQEADWLAVEEAVLRDSPKSDSATSSARETPAGSPLAEPFVAPPRPLYWPKVAAAIFLASTLGLLVLRFLAQDPAADKTLAMPKANIHFAELLPSSEQDTRAGSSPPIVVPAESGSLVLILATTSLRESSGYEAVIIGGTEGRRWRIDGLVQATDGTFSLHFPRTLLAPGAYSLELNALEGSTPVLIAKYQFDLELE